MILEILRFPLDNSKWSAINMHIITNIKNSLVKWSCFLDFIEQKGIKWICYWEYTIIADCAIFST